MKTTSSILVVLLLLLTASTAAAGTPTDLLDKVPAKSPLIIGIEMGKVRSTPLFNDAMQFFAKVAQPGSVLSFALSKKAFDVKKDIDNAVVALESTPLNIQAPPPASMAVIEGRFDQKRVTTAIEAQYGKLKTRKVKNLDVHSSETVEFAFVDANTLVITESGFAKATWDAIAKPGAAASSNKAVMALVELTDTTRGMWFAVHTKDVPTAEGAPPMDGGGIAVDIRNGLGVDFRTQFLKEDDATVAKAQFEEVKAGSKDNKMVGMLGATPLVDNMKATQSGNVLTIQSAITLAQTRTMITRLKAMNEKPPPVAPSGETGGPTTQPAQTGKGTQADFN